MLIGTLKAKKKLTDQGASDELAEAIVETINDASGQVATKADIWRIGFVIGGFYTTVLSLIFSLLFQ